MGSANANKLTSRIFVKKMYGSLLQQVKLRIVSKDEAQLSIANGTDFLR